MVQGDYPAKSNYYSSLGGFGITTIVPNATSLEECKDTCMKMPDCVQATCLSPGWMMHVTSYCKVACPQLDPGFWLCKNTCLLLFNVEEDFIFLRHSVLITF